MRVCASLWGVGILASAVVGEEGAEQPSLGCEWLVEVSAEFSTRNDGRQLDRPQNIRLKLSRMRAGTNERPRLENEKLSPETNERPRLANEKLSIPDAVLLENAVESFGDSSGGGGRSGLAIPDAIAVLLDNAAGESFGDSSGGRGGSGLGTAPIGGGMMPSPADRRVRRQTSDDGGRHRDLAPGGGGATTDDPGAWASASEATFIYAARQS
ncbi:hypothetical protein T484DRAFT_1791453 [Baffinella frigidus]|nr:hypothetical protein T484DRAFT_1791453 [Cryptophyta sp. CCMP2293]